MAKLKLVMLTAIGATLLPVTAQASIFGSKVSQSDQQAILNGQLGAISMSLMPQGMTCGTTLMTFQNVYSGQTYKTRYDLTFSDARRGLALKAVMPGTYRVVKASCINGNRTMRYKDIANFYGPIMVRPGEVVYPGTFSPKRAGRSVTGYNLIDHTMVKAQAMQSKYPALASRFVPRPVQTFRATAASGYNSYRR